MGIEQKRDFIIKFVYYLIIIGVAVAIFKYGLPLVMPFVLAFVFAYILRKPTKFLCKRYALPYKISALIMVVFFYCTIGLLIGLAIVKGFVGIRSAVGFIPMLYSTYIETALTEVLIKFETIAYDMDINLFAALEGINDQLMERLGNFISDFSTWAVGFVSNVATSIPGLFIKLVLMIIGTVFIAMDYDKIVGFFYRQLDSQKRNIVYEIKNYVIGTLFVCICSYGLIMSITFVELSIGLTIIGFDRAILIAACIAIFDILPVLGTGGIMIPWCVITLIRGNISLGLGLLAVYIVITVIRNILEPKIVGSQLGLHPIVTLCSLFVGAQLFGVVGLFGFPIGLSLIKHLNDKGTINWIK